MFLKVRNFFLNTRNLIDGVKLVLIKTRSFEAFVQSNNLALKIIKLKKIRPLHLTSKKF